MLSTTIAFVLKGRLAALWGRACESEEHAKKKESQNPEKQTIVDQKRARPRVFGFRVGQKETAEQCEAA